jgi:putative lipoprotein (rSAM/lipoprotein system)
MKIRFLKLKDWLLMSVMGLLGMTSCHCPKQVTETTPPQPDPKDTVVAPDPRNFAVMYGVPQMDFQVKGRVTDEQGKPVQGMQVILVNQTVDISPEYLQEDNPYVQEYIRNASDTTDAEGRFDAQARDVPVEAQRVLVRDIDGDKNGRYQDQMIEVKFTSEDQTEQGSKWYQGRRTKEVNITVEKKK